jgi:site-specific DNA-cytosine methylase
MKVLVACEFSGIVREAFGARGHKVASCDILPSEMPGFHFRSDVQRLLGWPWDLLLAFPPCTHLAASGARWFSQKRIEQIQAIAFFMAFAASKIKRVCIENPVGIMSTHWRKPDQIVQPWQFGHGETKATCLWLKNLPPLTPTNIVPGREQRVHRLPPSADRWKQRSRTYQGIAEAMAEQWGAL